MAKLSELLNKWVFQHPTKASMNNIDSEFPGNNPFGGGGTIDDLLDRLTVIEK